MIRSFTIDDIKSIAELQLRWHKLSPQILPYLYDINAVLLDSPLVNIQVIEKEGNIVGYLMSTTDGQRLVSDIFSRLPYKLTRLIFKFPTIAKQLRRIFKSRLHIKAFDSEILDLYAPAEAVTLEELKQLVDSSLEMLSKQGRTSVAIRMNFDILQRQVLGDCGFEIYNGDGKILSLPSNEIWHRKLVPDPNYMPGPFTLRDRLRCAFRFELMVVAPIYSLALIPFASYLAYWGTKLDHKLNLPSVLPYPWNFLAMIVMLFLGGLLLVYSYSYLILEGEGGPVPPYSAKTRRLVTTGPYAYVRHPSILAKLMGVIGLGLGFNSWCFLCLIIPLLMCWSIFWNRNRQDADLIHVFGEEYLRYRNKVRMLIPIRKK